MRSFQSYEHPKSNENYIDAEKFLYVLRIDDSMQVKKRILIM